MIPNYLKNSAVEIDQAGDVVIVKVYNDTGSAIAVGVPKLIVNKWITAIGAVAAPLAAATNTAVANIVGVPLEAHANATYARYQIKGLVPYVVTSGTVAANDNLEIINAGAALIDEGTDGGAVETSGALGVAVENVTTNVWKVYLRGKQVSVAAS